MQEVSTGQQSQCDRPNLLGNPCITKMLNEFDPVTMTYEGDIPCVPLDRALDCTTLGISTLTNILDIKGDMVDVIDNLMNEPFSTDTITSISNLLQ